MYHGTEPDWFLKEELPRLRAEFPKLTIDYTSRPPKETLGQVIAEALLRSKADYAGVLDDDDWYYPEHVQTLLDALVENPAATVAISGAAVDWEWSLNSAVTVPVNSYARDSSELLSFEPFEADRFNKGEMNICFAMLLFRREKIPADLSRMKKVSLAEDRVLLSAIANREHGAVVFTSRVSCSWAYRHLQQDNQIDMRNNWETPGLPTDLVYNALSLPYLECNRSEYNRHHSQSLADKCAALQKVPQRLRWIPRSVRPLTYQGKFNLLVTSILRELMSLEVLPKSDAVRVADATTLVDGTGHLFPKARQQEFNRVIGEILSSRISGGDLNAPQHTVNLTLARALDRASRSF